jgi:hypothetical protein
MKSVDAHRAPQVVSRLIELLESGRRGEPRRVHLHGRPGPGMASAVDFIAREARLRGFVPVATACLSPPAGNGAALDHEDLVRLIANRHVLLIHRHTEASVARFGLAVRLVLDLGLASSRPHLILIVNTADPAADRELRLTVPRGICECAISGWVPGYADLARRVNGSVCEWEPCESESYPAYRVPGPPGQAASSGTSVGSRRVCRGRSPRLAH